MSDVLTNASVYELAKQVGRLADSFGVFVFWFACLVVFKNMGGK